MTNIIVVLVVILIKSYKKFNKKNTQFGFGFDLKYTKDTILPYLNV